VQTLAEFFGPDSALKSHLPGFQPRAGQALMAEAVADAISYSRQVIIEAGTGTGKTFAYLLPALQSGKKTIISTGTKALQDQLYHRDLPLIGKAVGRPVTTALLKGRANYLCVQRLEIAEQGSPGQRSALLESDLRTVSEWRHRTRSGDRAELIDVKEDSPVWPQVTSTADNCLGSQCPLYKKCHVVKARKAAQEADLVVVNHHLLLADLALKEEGFIEFLPGAEAIILDEAHQLPDLAAQFFGVSIGSREIGRLLDEIQAQTIALKKASVNKAIAAAQQSLRELLADAPKSEGRHELSVVIDKVHAPLAALDKALLKLANGLSPLAGTSADIDKHAEQLMSVRERLQYIANDDSWDGLRWLDVRARSLRLHLTPLDVADTLRGLLSANDQAWVFTSATIAIGADFSHFATRMGLDSATALQFPSPYALENQGLVWLPPELPLPSDPKHTDEMMNTVFPLLDFTDGGMFCLFTSHRALNAARQWCKRRKARLQGRPLLVQGDAPRDDLLRRFRDEGNAVLLGTGSFWEGVDVRGKALSIVAIDKLPFASPGDPLMMARLEHIRRQGGNGFTGHQLPLAALALKQGAGRLLRDQNDIGVIAICDPRLRTKSYGKLFLQCLAPMPVTSSIDDVMAFFKRAPIDSMHTASSLESARI